LRRLKGWRGPVILRPVNMKISVNVIVIGPWPKTKVLRALDQKYDAALSSGSFLFMGDKDNAMH